MFRKFKKIHFVGIGGIGMSGIAEILHNLEYKITGSDISENANVQRLKSLGIKIFLGHSEENVKDVDLVVYSSAVKQDNPELKYALENYIPVIQRGEMLAELMRMKYSVVVAGSHGKTTTSSMIAEIFNAGGLNPTVVIGGRLNRNENNAIVGKSDIMVAEADESDRSFLMLYPTVSVITNIDFEHMESYKDFDDVKQSFAEFANKVPFYGANIICLDDPNVADIIPLLKKKFVTYGFSARADIRGTDIKLEGFGSSFNVSVHGKPWGRIKLSVPGEHNVLNALGAIGAGLEFDIPYEDIKKGLEDFSGVQRRLTIRYDKDEIKVIDDYGHHPTEIIATLKAIRDAYDDHKLIVIFQPHRYSRTKLLMNEFSKAFFDADELFITDIYAASEKPIDGVTSDALVGEIRKRGFKSVYHINKPDDFLSFVDDKLESKTIFLTLGAGNITNLSREIADYLEKKYA
ncbi:UDP-N-acetylmuramate--L-alanine ligase [Calditerrivibrio nitroreducens]|uniref:UDP-N-acetylmuramate--L-alanine ligase n=1 Tax=Calditerrivibrio nitroreducens TaxID=477976 RepID=UPI003C71EC80